ncbi:12615_t:CDS:2 [Dentiscutata erythropus]|uniref:12615_t:CDS:1 n=1 Tax=Dentiscutata erythropus TaxID=1348616 RepID=A0A9N8WHK5_9GLOM|nr:12615_t:CDS:2 [Dentiscutata erythropus]
MYRSEAEQTFRKYNEKIKGIQETKNKNITFDYLKEICIFLKKQTDIESEKEGNMETSFNKLLNGLDEWKDQQEQEAVFKIITAIGTAIGSMFTTNYEDIESVIGLIGDIGDSIVKIVKVIQEVNKLVKLLNEAHTNPTVVVPDNALSVMALDWEEWIINVKRVLDIIPDNEMLTKLKKDYCLSVEIMKNRGIALIGDIFTRNNQEEIEQFVKSSLDFGKLTETFEARVKLLTGQLVSLLMDQDKASQYEYFTEPILLNSYRINSILDVVSNQHASIIKELKNGFPTPPIDLRQPYIYHIITSSDTLSNYDSSDFYFDISTNDPFFRGYYRIRINEVQINLVDNSITTSDKKVYFEIYTNASPFYDIGYNSNSKEYKKISYFLDHKQDILFSGFYDIEKKKYEANKVNHDFRGTFVQITPFTGWQIRIPRDRGNNNQDLKFLSQKISINVIFKLSAITVI